MEKYLTIKIPEGFEIDKEKSTFEKIVFKSIERSKEDLNKEMSDFLFATINGCTMKMTGEKEITFYDSNNEWIIQQDWKNNRLWIRYTLIWKVIKEKYELNDQQIRDFIQSWVETNLNWKGFTPGDIRADFAVKVETNLNWKGFTPQWPIHVIED